MCVGESGTELHECKDGGDVKDDEYDEAVSASHGYSMYCVERVHTLLHVPRRYRYKKMTHPKVSPT